jgi:hypothetical protein
MLEVPLAYDGDGDFGSPDLRGALLSQSAVGEAFLSIDWINSLVTNGSDSAFFNGAGTTTAVLSAGTTISVTVFQEYLLPQSVGGQVPLPMLDLMTVYELNGALNTTSNIAAGQETLINYPNVRSVIGAYFNFSDNLLLTAANISRMRLIANGNNVLREYTNQDKYFDQRIYCDTDIRPGVIFEMHRRKPIETALFGNIQYGLYPSSITATPSIEVMFESFYTKGSALPGMMQGT